jgi:solute carrier family 23 (nucleobase transporter), member 1
MALQHYLTMIGAIVSIPFILTPALCMDNDDPSRGKIISTMIFVTGLVTYFQVTWGCRLPIVQVSIVEQIFFGS